MKAYKTVSQKVITTDSVYYVSGSTRYSVTDYINSKWVDKIYPVGTIYLTVSDSSPSTLFGGTWVKQSGGYLYCSAVPLENSTYTGTGTQNSSVLTSGSTTLTAAQSGLPRHYHDMIYSANSSGTSQCDFRYVVSSASASTSGRGWVGNLGTMHYGGQAATSGHTHTVPAHTHNVAYIRVWCWKRTA